MRLVLLALALSGCSSDLFFVRRDGADLPVWVRGDPSSETVVLVQHGLGTTGAFYDSFPAFDALEAEQAVVYWDQRGAGLSQGNASADSLTVANTVADLDLVRAAVEERYDPERLVLLGHSLGGGISLAYLRDTNRASGVAGYVDVSGGRSLREAYDTVRQRLIAFAEQQVLADEDAATWQEALAFYEQTTRFPREEPGRSQHAGYVSAMLETQGFDYEGSTQSMASHLRTAGVRETLTGGFDLLGFAGNTSRLGTSFDLDGMDLSAEEVSTVPVPALVLDGRHDLSVPVEHSEATWQALPAPGPSRFEVLEDAGHFPMWDQPDAFADTVQAFVDEL